MTTKNIEKFQQKPLEEKQNSIESFIEKAIEKGDIAIIEKMLALRDKFRAEQAKEAFSAAMSRFQAECPIIEKKKEGSKTNSGQIAFWYAPLESIVEQTKEIITKNGFSYSFKTETLPDRVKAYCIIEHELGHSKETIADLPNAKGTNIMSAPQITAATITFAKRYAFINAFGIMTREEDLDSIKQEKPFLGFDYWKNLLESAKNLSELSSSWTRIPKELQTHLAIVKDSLKLKFKASDEVENFDSNSIQYPA